MQGIKSLTSGVLLALSLLLVPATASAQKTLTFGGSDSIGSMLDRQNARFTGSSTTRPRASSRSISSRASSSAATSQVIEQTMRARCTSTATCSTGTPTG